MNDDIRMSNSTFSTPEGHVVKKGDMIRAGHPILEAHGEKFGDLKVKWEKKEENVNTESATAAPNETRSLDLSHMEEEEERTTEDLDDSATVGEKVAATDHEVEEDSEVEEDEIERVNPEDYSLEGLKELAKCEGVADYGSRATIADRINRKRGV